MKAIKDSVAGSLESSDVLVTIAPSGEKGVGIQVESIVEKQYGARIRRVAEELVAAAGLESAKVRIQDRGALECTLRARLETAIARAAS